MGLTKHECKDCARRCDKIDFLTYSTGNCWQHNKPQAIYSSVVCSLDCNGSSTTQFCEKPHTVLPQRLSLFAHLLCQPTIQPSKAEPFRIWHGFCSDQFIHLRLCVLLLFKYRPHHHRRHHHYLSRLSSWCRSTVRDAGYSLHHQQHQHMRQCCRRRGTNPCKWLSDGMSHSHAAHQPISSHLIDLQCNIYTVVPKCLLLHGSGSAVEAIDNEEVYWLRRQNCR